MPKFYTAEEVSKMNNAEDQEDDGQTNATSNGSYEFEHQSFKLQRPKRVAKIPVGEYEATISKIKQTREPSFEDREILVDRVAVLLELDYKSLVTGKEEHGFVQKRMNLSFHEKAKLSEFLRAAVGDLPDEVDSDALIGKKVKITILHNESKAGDTYDNVAKFSKVK
jgi:hypothetical protein